MYLPYPSWLNAGDNAWQMTAATLVGLMSLPGLAVLYGGVVKRKFGVNTMMMAFSGFSLVLVVWVLWAYKMGFGTPWIGGHYHLLGKPGLSTGAYQEEQQANIPLLAASGPAFRFPQASLTYFQFVFAAITPLLFLGSVIGRMNFKAWLIFVPLWTSLAYTVNAFLIWGGGYWGGKGALDYSGGYVIHLAAGTTGFVAAAVIGPRMQRDRDEDEPNNLLLVAVGAGLLWLGWNGFNGGDPYFAGADAAAAVINTNLCTAVALLVWMIMDMTLSVQKKPTFLGCVNGMIVGLVGITPAAGYVNGSGAIFIGIIATIVVWFAFNKLSQVGFFKKVDDTLGVVYTHGIAGLMGGLLVGLFADPHVIIYLGANKATSNVTVAGLFYGHPKQLALQAGAAATVIVWDALVTFVLLKLIGLIVPLRTPEADLEIGDAAIHGETLYDDDPEPGGVPTTHQPAHVSGGAFIEPPGAVAT